VTWAAIPSSAEFRYWQSISPAHPLMWHFSQSTALPVCPSRFLCTSGQFKIRVYAELGIRAFLAWRRGVELVDGQEVAVCDGKLKTDWTEPRPRRRAMGIEWRPSGSR
jgi:hypothetical protein